MDLKYILNLSEAERDLIIDLIEHRVFLIRSRFDNDKQQSDCKELQMLEQIGDRLVWCQFS